MNIYILKKDLHDAEAGTRLYFEDEMYSYKSITGEQKLLSKAEVEGNTEFFRPLTTMEFMYQGFQYKL